jgi:hypothetical protein
VRLARRRPPVRANTARARRGSRGGWARSFELRRRATLALPPFRLRHRASRHTRVRAHAAQVPRGGGGETT